MDPSRFDHLTQLCDAAGGRRAVLGALLGAVLGGTVTEATTENKKRRSTPRDRWRIRHAFSLTL